MIQGIDHHEHDHLPRLLRLYLAQRLLSQVKVGTELAVVLNSYEAIKKAFSQDELTSRPDTFMFRFFSHGEHGIASASGEKWKVQSKFAQTQFKKLGAGSAKMEQFIQDEVDDLVNGFKGDNG